jgi:hypothetical protein
MFTSGITLFGASFLFTSLVLYLLLVALLVQFRIAVWRLKEVAPQRVSAVASASHNSARKNANSYTDSMSKGMSANSADGTEMTSTSATKSATQGVSVNKSAFAEERRQARWSTASSPSEEHRS